MGIFCKLSAEWSPPPRTAKGALLTLVLNGYGQDAVKIARSIYEIELNVLWLKNHPEDLADFLDYSIIQQKQLYDEMTEEQQNAIPKERYEEMIADYNRVQPRSSPVAIKRARGTSGAGFPSTTGRKRPSNCGNSRWKPMA